MQKTLIANTLFSEISINNPNGRYKLTEEHESLYSYRIALTITNVAMTDLGNYTCGARNSYGTVQGTISLKSKKIELIKLDNFQKSIDFSSN